MKNIIKYLPLFILLVPYTLFGQNLNNKTRLVLNQIAIKLTNDGICERMLNLGYLESPDNYDNTYEFLPRNENTYVFLRFDFNNSTSQGSTDFLIGKVFMSERYIEKSYRKVYKDISAFKNDNDGFFMYCKLYFDNLNDEFRINIYPEYISNMCSEKMHWNKKICRDNHIHDNSINSILAFQDYHFEDFTKINIIETANFINKIKTTNGLNFKFNKLTKEGKIQKNKILKYSWWKPRKNILLKLRSNDLIRSINISKSIKYFTLKYDYKVEKIHSLKLVHTKYALSEDLIDRGSFDFKFRDYQSINQELEGLTKHTIPVLITQNKWYKNYFSSQVPDDKYIKGFAMTNNERWEYIDDQQKILLDNQLLIKEEIKKLDLEKAKNDSTITINVDSLRAIVKDAMANDQESSIRKNTIDSLETVSVSLNTKKGAKSGKIITLNQQLSREKKVLNDLKILPSLDTTFYLNADSINTLLRQKNIDELKEREDDIRNSNEKIIQIQEEINKTKSELKTIDDLIIGNNGKLSGFNQSLKKLSDENSKLQENANRIENKRSRLVQIADSLGFAKDSINKILNTVDDSTNSIYWIYLGKIEAASKDSVFYSISNIDKLIDSLKNQNFYFRNLYPTQTQTNDLWHKGNVAGYYERLPRLPISKQLYNLRISIVDLFRPKKKWFDKREIDSKLFIKGTERRNITFVGTPKKKKREKYDMYIKGQNIKKIEFEGYKYFWMQIEIMPILQIVEGSLKIELINN